MPSNAAYQHLAQGATTDVVANYTVTDEHGATSTSTLTITLTGTNDTPVAVADTNSGSEDTTITGSVATNDSDVDDGAILTYGLNGRWPGSRSTPTAATASMRQRRVPAPGARRHHRRGGQLHGDRRAWCHQHQQLTITLTGTNDAPVAVADSQQRQRRHHHHRHAWPATTAMSMTARYSATHSNAPVAGLTLNANGSYSFDAGNAAYQHLAQGATTDVVANYTVTDEQGATSTSTLTITLTGTNDAPVAVADSNSGNEDTTITGSVATNDSDVDDGAILTYSLNAPVAGLTLNANGSYSFDAGNAAYQHLAQGATTNVVANYTVTDEQGATSTSTLDDHLDRHQRRTGSSSR